MMGMESIDRTWKRILDGMFNGRVYCCVVSIYTILVITTLCDVITKYPIEKAMLVWGACIVLWDILNKRHCIYGTGSFWLFLLCLANVITLLLHSQNRNVTLWSMCFNVLLFFVFYAKGFCSNEKMIFECCLFLSAAASVVELLSLYSVFSKHPQALLSFSTQNVGMVYGDFCGITLNANLLGLIAFCALGACVWCGVYLLRLQKKGTFVLLCLWAATHFFIMSASYSRTAWISFAVTGMIIGGYAMWQLLSRKEKRLWKSIIAVLFAILCALFIMLCARLGQRAFYWMLPKDINKKDKDEILSTLQEDSHKESQVIGYREATLKLGVLSPTTTTQMQRIKIGASAQERLIVWNTGIRIWRLAPVFGVGQGNITALYAELCNLTVPMAHLHSGYLQLLAANGIAGLLLFIVFTATALRCSWKDLCESFSRKASSADVERIVLFAFIAGVYVYNLPEVSFMSDWRPICVILWLLLGRYSALISSPQNSSWNLIPLWNTLCKHLFRGKYMV